MNIVADMLLTEPAPMAIWATLIVLAFLALALLGSPDGGRDPRLAAQQVMAAFRARAEQRRERIAEAGRAARYAEEITVAADRAAVSADRWQERWHDAEHEVATSWQAWLDADARLRRARTAAAFGTPWSVRTCEEYAARERFLHRTVTAAAARGDLPAAAVADARAGRHGWDARLHPVQQELVIAAASASWLRARYDRAVAAELTARHDADLNRRAGHTLRAEAATATAHAAALAATTPKRAAAAVPARRRRTVEASIV